MNEENALEISAADLGLSTTDEPVVDDVVDPVETPAEPAEVAAAPATDTTTVVTRAVPKSWPQEMHEHWGKIDPKVQEYWETREKQMLDGLDQYKGDAGFGKVLKDAITPYQSMLEAHKIDAPKAVSFLLAAHQRLTMGTPESRQAAYQELGRNLGLSADVQPNAELEALRQQVHQLTQGFTQEQTAKQQAHMAKVQQEVTEFAANTKEHPYFDECAADIARLVGAGYDLPEAYKTAVWANPVTAAKEQARLLKEHEDKLRENQRLDALKARKASSNNVRSRETTRAPTEPLGTMEDTMKETLAAINARTH